MCVHVGERVIEGVEFAPPASVTGFSSGSVSFRNSPLPGDYRILGYLGVLGGEVKTEAKSPKADVKWGQNGSEGR